MARNLFLTVSMFLVCAMLSCSGGLGAPVSPAGSASGTGSSLAAQQTPDSSGSSRYLWGYWTMRWNPEAQKLEAIPLRTTELHVNVVRALEDGMCLTCLVIGKNEFNADGDLEVHIFIIHPVEDTPEFDADVFTGFDVRGIAIFEGTYYFDENGLKTSWHEYDEFTLVNADGYTKLWSPAAYPPDWFGRPIFEYYPGKYEANGSQLSTTLNPFRAFYTLSERRTFEALGQDERIFTIRFPHDPGVPLEFGYAVDASWAAPSNLDNPLVPDDFPPNANAIEAYRITAEFSGSLTPIGGQSFVLIHVYDWQGNGTIASVSLEAPDLFNGIVTANHAADFPTYSEFTATINNGLLADLGTYPVLITVEDTATVAIVGKINAYDVFTIDVIPPLDLLETVPLACDPIEGDFDTVTQTCYFAPVPGVLNKRIMGIDSTFNVVTGFPKVLATGGIGLCGVKSEIYLATDIGTPDFEDDISVFDIDAKALKYAIDIVTPNGSAKPIDFVAYDLMAEVWVSRFNDNLVGVFFADNANPDITGIDLDGTGPTTLALDDANYQVFVACDGSDTIAVIDGYGHSLKGTIELNTPLVSPDPLLPAVIGMAYVPSSNMLYATTLGAGKVEYYDLSDYSYKGSIQLMPEDTGAVVGLVYDPGLNILVATGQVASGHGHLWAIDPVANEEIYDAETTGMNPSFPGIDKVNHILFVPDPIGHVDIFKIVN